MKAAAPTEQLDLFAVAAAEIPTPWRDDERPMPQHDPCEQMRWPVEGDPWSIPGFDAYGAACEECGLPPRAHWHNWYRGPREVSPAGDTCWATADNRDSRWDAADGRRWAGGAFTYRGRCECGWHATRGRRHEATAFYEALFHAQPDWLTLPLYTGKRNVDGAKATAKRDAMLLDLYGPDPMVILTHFGGRDPQGRHRNCRGVVPGTPIEICVDPYHRLDLLGLR